MGTRTRFAPSPTGKLHTGGARCALFNFLYARATGGAFVLRIEDTDLKRSEKRFLDDIIDGMRWLGLDWDEGPHRQSEALDVYAARARELLERGLAFPDPDGTPAIYFRAPAERVHWYDMVHGKVEFDNALLEPMVIMKSDGTPTYNFACVVDDLRHGITHVIRGDDHISNTPKQLAVYSALDAKPPKFAHIPLILGPDKKRLSKRHGAKAVTEYRDEGILSEALFNFLALLSWSAGDDRELMSRKEIMKKFSLKRVRATPAVFDHEKLLWLNMQYIKRLSEDDLARRLAEYAPAVAAEDGGERLLRGLARLYRVRLRRLSDIREAAAFFFGPPRYDEGALRRHIPDAAAADRLRELGARLERITDWSEAEIDRVVRAFAEERKLDARALIHPARVAVTGGEASPGLFEVMALLGREKVVSRLKNAPRP